MTRGKADKHDRVVCRYEDEAVIRHRLTSGSSASGEHTLSELRCSFERQQKHPKVMFYLHHDQPSGLDG
jgi:hypothetical protein